MQSIRKDQSKILLISSLTEFGERYSAYILQSLLILFLIYHFKLAENISASLVGTVLSMTYISAIVGGFIADRILGYYRAAFIGSLLMIIGSLLLSISQTVTVLYIGLCFISISTGLIKSNMSSFIGRYYDQAGLPHSHRDFGFSIFYVGINLGAFFALFLASFLAKTYGYNAAFYSSVLINAFMISNLIFGFFKLKKYIADVRLTVAMLLKSLIIIIIYMIIVLIILRNPIIANISIFIAAILCALVLIRSAIKTGFYKNAIIATLFFVLSVIYWAVYFQIFISIELFINHIVNHHFLGFMIDTTQFLRIEGLFILLFGFLMGKFWIYLDNRGKAAHDIDKFNLAFVLILLMLLIFYVAIWLSPANAKLPALVIIVGFLLLAISELSLSAIGLSLITKIAPKGFVSLYMGIWLVTLGIGGKLAGLMAQGVTISKNIEASKVSMQHGLLLFIACTIAAIIICLLSRKFIINGIKKTTSTT